MTPDPTTCQRATDLVALFDDPARIRHNCRCERTQRQAAGYGHKFETASMARRRGQAVGPGDRVNSAG